MKNTIYSKGQPHSKSTTSGGLQCVPYALSWGYAGICAAGNDRMVRFWDSEVLRPLTDCRGGGSYPLGNSQFANLKMAIDR